MDSSTGVLVFVLGFIAFGVGAVGFILAFVLLQLQRIERALLPPQVEVNIRTQGLYAKLRRDGGNLGSPLERLLIGAIMTISSEGHIYALSVRVIGIKPYGQPDTPTSDLIGAIYRVQIQAEVLNNALRLDTPPKCDYTLLIDINNQVAEFI
jgi:hypothetical protein